MTWNKNSLFLLWSNDITQSDPSIRWFQRYSPSTSCLHQTGHDRCFRPQFFEPVLTLKPLFILHQNTLSSKSVWMPITHCYTHPQPQTPEFPRWEGPTLNYCVNTKQQNYTQSVIGQQVSHMQVIFPLHISTIPRNSKHVYELNINLASYCISSDGNIDTIIWQLLTIVRFTADDMMIHMLL